MSTDADMRRAVALDAVREYLERQMAAIEPDYRFELSQDEHPPDWPAIWTRRTWLYWLEKKALRRAERAGVGAVLGERLDEGLLETLDLLGEQLHEQQGEWTDASGRRRGGGVVSRNLTQDAVTPFWTSPTSLSASAEGWRRRCEAERRRGAPASLRAESDKRALLDFEHGLRQALDALGDSKPKSEVEAVHRYVDRAGRALTDWRALYDLEETDERDLYEQLNRARAAAYAAVAACREAGEPVDPDELQSIAKAIEEACRRSLEHRLWQINKALGGSNPHGGLEDVHHHAERAACHVAACRVLSEWGADERERLEKLEKAREAAHAAVAACPADEVPALDRVDLHEIAIELRKIAEALDV